MGFEDAKVAVDAFSRLPATAPEPEVRAAATRAITALHHECVRVQQQANGYPSNPIAANVWMDGALLGAMAAGLAEPLGGRGLLELEEKAQTLRCMAVLAVQGHYHHIVSPAMIARAECNERLGNAELAGQLYRAVVANFKRIADEWEPTPADSTPDPPGDEDRVSLQCLLRAVEGVQKLNQPGTDAAEMETLRRRCAALLARASHS